MKIFKPAVKQNAYLKAGLLGFAGSGKSRTSTEIAIGLHKYLKSKKPIYYCDTETGSDYLMSRYDKAKINLMVSKSRAFKDLLEAVDTAEKDNAILIIDSVTHFWTELCQAYMKKKGIQRLVIHHWIDIKKEWRPFSERYINSKCHIIMAGRAGWEFDKEVDNEGYSELTKTGTRMKGESEMGFEPSLLVEMEKVRLQKGKIGGNYKRRAWIIKDRFDVIDGKYFDNPTFKNFLPHIELLNLGGDHVGIEADKDSTELFNTDQSVTKRLRDRDILIEEINNELTLAFNSKTDEGKKKRLDLLKFVFGTTSKTAIENMQNETLAKGLEDLIDLIDKEKRNDSRKN